MVIHIKNDHEPGTISTTFFYRNHFYLHRTPPVIQNQHFIFARVSAFCKGMCGHLRTFHLDGDSRIRATETGLVPQVLALKKMPSQNAQSDLFNALL